VTGVPVDVRHPFFDLRVVQYLLAVPAIPWCFDKTIVRLAMRGALPEAVRLRPKSVPAGDPLAAMLAEPAARWVDRFEPIPAWTYVNRERIPQCAASRTRKDLDEPASALPQLLAESPGRDRSAVRRTG
jgi:asparagine synthase (glutamine-hydrolysing)